MPCYCSFYALLIIIMILLMCRCCEWFENDLPAGYTHDSEKIYTSDATMRVLGQKFTSTNQGEPSIVYNKLAQKK